MGEKSIKLEDMVALAAKYEKKMNSLIQEIIDDEDFLPMLQAGLRCHLKVLKRLHHFSKKTAEELHLPTKDDLAAVAKLCRQVEEKLDQMEDQFHCLLNKIHNEKEQCLSKCVDNVSGEKEPNQEANDKPEASVSQHSGRAHEHDLCSLLKPMKPEEFVKTILHLKKKKIEWIKEKTCD